MNLKHFILTVNRAKVGEILHDSTYSAMETHYRPFINSMIKLGYIERIEWDKIKKINNIPEDMTFKKARELTIGMKLPKRQKASTWGKVIIQINESSTDIILIKPNDTIGRGTYYGYDSVKVYLNWLSNLEFINIIKKSRNFGFKVERLKPK